jgi:3-methyladenine DNA glycosylase AlkD
VTPDAAVEALRAAGDADRAAKAAAYHKTAREYLGVPVPVIAAMADEWRAGLDVRGRVALADALWHTDIHEARVAAAKLLVQARIKDDGAVWALIASWVPQFDAWALADHACDAGRRRLEADPSRLDEVEGWTQDANFWVRRAALVMTLPWTKQNHPKPQDEAIRDRILGWAAGMADDREWFIQKAIAWWLRELSKHDAPRVQGWLDTHGPRLKAFARKEAAQYLPPVSVNQIFPPEAPPLASDAPEA